MEYETFEELYKDNKELISSVGGLISRLLNGNFLKITLISFEEIYGIRQAREMIMLIDHNIDQIILTPPKNYNICIIAVYSCL